MLEISILLVCKISFEVASTAIIFSESPKAIIISVTAGDKDAIVFILSGNIILFPALSLSVLSKVFEALHESKNILKMINSIILIFS
ncbi:hypothetical protein [Brachyspira murdochii]|uniref:hypothetical protein n=1 Tax=Brachyspira murdochii TaxID=84378 RepID=UPI003F686E99